MTLPVPVVLNLLATAFLALSLDIFLNSFFNKMLPVKKENYSFSGAIMTLKPLPWNLTSCSILTGKSILSINSFI